MTQKAIKHPPLSIAAYPAYSKVLVLPALRPNKPPAYNLGFIHIDTKQNTEFVT